jgi:hypothetical protein
MMNSLLGLLHMRKHHVRILWSLLSATRISYLSGLGTNGEESKSYGELSHPL